MDATHGIAISHLAPRYPSGQASANTYADPLLVSNWTATITTASPSIETLEPNSSFAAQSPAVSFATCVQPEVRSPPVARMNTYADPLLSPLSSSRFAPITIVSPSIDTLLPNQ